jgi:hypothetical protein
MIEVGGDDVSTSDNGAFGTKYRFDYYYRSLTITRNLRTDDVTRGKDRQYHIVIDNHGRENSIVLSTEQMLELFKAFLNMEEEYDNG